MFNTKKKKSLKETPENCMKALEFFNLEKNLNITKSIVKKLNIQMEFDEVLSNLCYSIEGTNDILIDYRYFKCFINPTQYDIIFQHFCGIIKKIIENNKTFNIHLYIKSISVMDVEKYYSFIGQMSLVMKDAFPDKLGICYIYNASFIFSKIIKLISKFIDQKTREKIELIEEKSD
jgi:hypothetical protein